MTDISLATVLSAAGGGVVVPFLNKVLGPVADEVGLVLGERVRMFRLQNQIRLFARAQQMLSTAGIEPKQVSLKTLLPLMEGASVEDDPALSERWSALLANAANPKAKVLVEPSFADVLKQLTPKQALVLGELYAHLYPDPMKFTFTVCFSDALAKSLGLSERELGFQVDNLLRLRLCDSHDHVFVGDEVFPKHTMKSTLSQTVFGRAFMLACDPPKEAASAKE